MNETFFVRREGKIEGPFEESFIIGVIKQGKLKPTDELASNQNGPWEVAESHPVFISAKPKKKKAVPISEYKVLTRKASEDKYEIRYWCPKCTATVTLEEEEALGDYRCPACGVPSTVIGTAFEEIAADRNERKREEDEREIKLLEEQRLAEERRLAKKGWGRIRRYAVNFLFSLGGLCVGVGTTALYMQTWPSAQEGIQPKNNSGLVDTHQPEKGLADNPQRIRTEERREYQTANPPIVRRESAEQFMQRQQNEGFEAARAAGSRTLMQAFDPGRFQREQNGYLPGETTEDFFERQRRQGESYMRQMGR